MKILTFLTIMFCSMSSMAFMEPETLNPAIPRAGNFVLKIEDGVVFPLARPQSKWFAVGEDLTLQALWPVTNFWEIGPSVNFMILPYDISRTGFGTAWMIGGDVRFKRPYDTKTSLLRDISPWIDSRAFFVRTGDFNRPGFSLAAGFTLPVEKYRRIRIGPFVRYTQIMQFMQYNSSKDYLDNDARFVSAGVNIEIVPGVAERCDTWICSVELPAPVAVAEEEPACPIVEKPVIVATVVNESVYSYRGRISVRHESLATLGKIVKILEDNLNLQVEVNGCASPEGNAKRNQTLSEKRAAVVVKYLVDHGISADRISSQGFGSVPVADDRVIPEANRRVDIVAH